MASPISYSRPYLPFAAALEFRVCTKSTASLQTASSHVPQGFPMALLFPKQRPITLVGTGELSIHAMWLANLSLFRRKNI